MSWINVIQDRDIVECRMCGTECHTDFGYCPECDTELDTAEHRPEGQQLQVICLHEDYPCCGCDSPINKEGNA
jgi:hypothetical protein